MDSWQPSPSAVPAVRAMFEARKRVFVDRLKWDVPVHADRFEIDQFDTARATYLVLSDPGSVHRASTRLLATEDAHILSDLFPYLCSDRVPTGPEVREITRFCIDPALPRTRRRRARNELVSALVDHALAQGIRRYTAVANIAWFRQISGFGWTCRPLGPSYRGQNGALIALEITIEASTPARLAARNIYAPARYRVFQGGDGR